MAILNRPFSAIYKLFNQMGQMIQKYFGGVEELQQEAPNATYFITNFVWIITRGLVNLLLIFSFFIRIIT